MTYIKYCYSFFFKFKELIHTFKLESDITYCQRLIYNKNIWLYINRNSKCQSDKHTT